MSRRSRSRRNRNRRFRIRTKRLNKSKRRLGSTRTSFNKNISRTSIFFGDTNDSKSFSKRASGERELMGRTNFSSDKGGDS